MLQRIRPLLSQPPYQGKTADEIVALLNTPVPTLRPLPVTELRIWLIELDGIARLAQIDQAHPCYSIAQILLMLCREPERELDLTNPKIQTAIAALVTANVITQAESNSLTALATVPTLPLGEVVDLGLVLQAIALEEAV